MQLLIYGSKNFAATVTELVRHCGHEAAGMVDDYNAGPGVIGDLATVARTHPPSDYGIAIAIGYANLKARWAAWEKVRSTGYRSPALIHPRAYVADTARIGEGSMLMAGAIVDVRAEIGDLAVLWPGACVNHDSAIGANTFISPNATVCGHAQVGAHSFIGAGAVVVDHGQVPEAGFVAMLARHTERTGAPIHRFRDAD
jgi:sugar O-acyltransferase (sialic acid O-acetyltransferase NeuD family)